jgi:hypothetical protein
VKGVFSIKEKDREEGEVSLDLRMTANDRTQSYLAKLKNITLFDAQRDAVNFLLELSPCKFRLGSSFYCFRKLLGFRLDFILSPFSSFSTCS